MFKTVKYNQWPKSVDFVKTLDEIYSTVKRENKFVSALYGFRKWDDTFSIRINANEHYTCDSKKEFMSVISSISYFEYFSWHVLFAPKYSIHGLLSSKRFGLGVDYSKTNIEVSVHADDNLGFIEKTQDLIAKKISLKISEKLEKDSYRRKMLEPKIFISRHFDVTTNNLYYSLSTFLNLIGFEVVQGEEYVSDLIPEKVAHKIEEHDILIALINGERDHDWIISEIGFAKGKDKHIILIKEENTLFNSAILGKDYEYIKFREQQIEQSYVPLI